MCILYTVDIDSVTHGVLRDEERGLAAGDGGRGDHDVHLLQDRQEGGLITYIYIYVYIYIYRGRERGRDL